MWIIMHSLGLLREFNENKTTIKSETVISVINNVEDGWRDYLSLFY